MRQTRWLMWVPFLVLAAVVGSFVASAVYVEHYTYRLRETALSITHAAVPRLEPLTAMRIQIHRIVTLGHSEGDALPPDQRLAIVRKAKQRFDDAFRTYSQLPQPEGRDQLGVDMAAAVERLDRATALALAEAEEPDSGGEPSTPMTRELREAAEATTRLLMQNMALDARTAHEAGAALDAAQSRSLRLAHALYGLCAIAAALGAAFAAGMVRRHLRLSAKYVELQAERAAELEQFSARVAHDILGPLQPVSLGVELLGRKLSGDPEAEALLGRIRRSLGRVGLIVDGLLRFARAGAHPEPGESVSLGQVVQGLREDLGPTAESAGVTFSIEPVPDVRVACAEATLTVVLQNLIRNAIKYIGDGPRRQIVTRASLVPGAVHLVVQDTGPGLPPGLEQRVFEPYVRGAGETQPGIGLGLATVKRIAEAHGGRVGVCSHPGKGAAFWVDLPLSA